MMRLSVDLLAKNKPSDKHWYAYDVLLDGEIIVADSRDPAHDLARALLTRGIKGRVEVLDGKTGRPRYTVNIEAAAKRCMSSNLQERNWKPLERLAVRPLTDKSSIPEGVVLR
jgi:hypothetical protein